MVETLRPESEIVRKAAPTGRSGRAPHAGFTVDAHSHLRDPSRGDYGWLTPDLAALYRPVLADEMAPLLDRAEVERAILVQAAPTEAETDWLLAIADAQRWVAGVVGWIDLDAPDAVARIAARATDSRLVGIRPMLEGLADRDWILGPARAAALGVLAEQGLVFDALVAADQLPTIGTLAGRHPRLRIVLDHGAKPAIGSDGPDAPWRRAIGSLAAHANVTCKLSGFLTEAPAGAGADMLRPYVDVLLAEFGAERLIWGSDWPVLTLASDYASWHDMARALVSADAHAAVFGDNARRIYRLAER